jgi:hypothetical protein
MNPSTTDRHAAENSKPDWLEVVRRNVAQLRFGSVQITVHDGRVTQVESTEKTRFATSHDDAKAKLK